MTTRSHFVLKNFALIIPYSRALATRNSIPNPGNLLSSHSKKKGLPAFIVCGADLTVFTFYQRSHFFNEDVQIFRCDTVNFW